MQNTGRLTPKNGLKVSQMGEKLGYFLLDKVVLSV
jgi:hypothetical protein